MLNFHTGSRLNEVSSKPFVEVTTDSGWAEYARLKTKVHTDIQFPRCDLRSRPFMLKANYTSGAWIHDSTTRAKLQGNASDDQNIPIFCPQPSLFGLTRI